MSEFWHKLGCCVVEKPQPVSLPTPHPNPKSSQLLCAVR
uniref:Isoform 2 of CDC42 small effector protein 1 n=1 Tax=Homo sapiens TaxID=9606 RepID=Q9NRR8-2|nr:signaling molecule SPEC1 beta [Homo sapiens]